MIKKIFCLLTILFISLIFITSVKGKQNINEANDFIYLYSNDCGYCIKFNPVYNKIKNNYNNIINFTKINISSEKGKQIATNYGISYIPYVIMINESKERATVDPGCLLKFACVDKTMKDFYNLK